MNRVLARLRAGEPGGTEEAARAPARGRGALGAGSGVCACVLALLLSLGLTFGAGSASAVIVHLAGGKTLSYQPLRGRAGPVPFDQLFSNLDYNGGPVMASNTNYPVYWAPAGSPKYPADYQPGVNRYFEDLAHDSSGTASVESVSAQYNDAKGHFASYSSFFGGALIDTNPYPVNGCKKASICLTDAQLQAELTSFVKAQGLPMDLVHEYFLLTPPGVENCFQKSGRECSVGTSAPAYCAYHGAVTVPGGVIVYSNDPYVTGNASCDDGNHPNGSSADGVIVGGLSHEHNESLTDPEPNNAWTDIGGSGGEIGDKCRTFEAGSEFGPPLGNAPDGAKYNQVINGHPYWYQQEWSNQSKKCLQRLSFSGEVPTATFTGAPAGGNAVSFDATGSSAPGGVARYNWQFNDGPGLSVPTETTTPTLTHAFPAAGIYTVALTVFASDGTSIGTARTLTVGTLPPPAVTRVAPKKGPAGGGTIVTITGSQLTGATAVSFGGVAATSFTVSSATSITALVPAGTGGTVDVRVTTPGGPSATVAGDHFTYTPSLSGLSPATGPRAGGMPVTITGTGFALGTSATTFRFGTAKAASVNCTSTTSCLVVAPAHAPGVVDVKAGVNGLVTAKSEGDQFSYT
jgi:hypothetical protein